MLECVHNKIDKKDVNDEYVYTRVPQAAKKRLRIALNTLTGVNQLSYLCYRAKGEVVTADEKAVTLIDNYEKSDCHFNDEESFFTQSALHAPEKTDFSDLYDRRQQDVNSDIESRSNSCTPKTREHQFQLCKHQICKFYGQFCSGGSMQSIFTDNPELAPLFKFGGSFSIQQYFELLRGQGVKETVKQFYKNFGGKFKIGDIPKSCRDRFGKENLQNFLESDPTFKQDTKYSSKESKKKALIQTANDAKEIIALKQELDELKREDEKLSVGENMIIRASDPRIEDKSKEESKATQDKRRARIREIEKKISTTTSRSPILLTRRNRNAGWFEWSPSDKAMTSPIASLKEYAKHAVDDANDIKTSALKELEGTFNRDRRKLKREQFKDQLNKFCQIDKGYSDPELFQFKELRESVRKTLRRDTTALASIQESVNSFERCAESKLRTEEMSDVILKTIVYTSCPPCALAIMSGETIVDSYNSGEKAESLMNWQMTLGLAADACSDRRVRDELRKFEDLRNGLALDLGLEIVIPFAIGTVSNSRKIFRKLQDMNGEMSTLKASLGPNNKIDIQDQYRDIFERESKVEGKKVFRSPAMRQKVDNFLAQLPPDAREALENSAEGQLLMRRLFSCD